MNTENGVNSVVSGKACRDWQGMISTQMTYINLLEAFAFEIGIRFHQIGSPEDLNLGLFCLIFVPKIVCATKQLEKQGKMVRFKGPLESQSEGI